MNSQRRSFLTGLKAGIAGLAIGGAVKGQSKSAGARWEPARHDKDDWLETPGAKHRLIFDTTTAEGFSEAVLFAGNYIHVNNTDYGLQNSDLAIVIVARHHSTSFGYNDAMWQKYGISMAKHSEFADPRTKQTPTANVYRFRFEAVAKQGVQLAVCSVATGVLSTIIAADTGGNAEIINKELVANRIAGSIMVPAGIVAVNRAQERGYSLVRA